MQQYKKLRIATVVKKAVPKPMLELTAERIEKLKNFGEVMLTILSVATIATMAVVAPNAIQALKMFEKKRDIRSTHKEKVEKVARTFYYLRRRSYIHFKRKGQDFEITLERNGQKQIRRLEFENLKIAKSESWDGYFWLVAADIPTKYKTGADMMRIKIKELGLYPLQRTLWFYPYDPSIEMEFVARAYGVNSFMTVMKIQEMDREDYDILKSFF